MRKFLLILMVLLCGCISCIETPSETPPETEDVPRGGFYLTGRVTAVNDRIEIEVIEGDYAEGIFWVLFSDRTVYVGADGALIDHGAIGVGDTVEVEYGGQMMMSYPPQIVAARITKLA